MDNKKYALIITPNKEDIPTIEIVDYPKENHLEHMYKHLNCSTIERLYFINDMLPGLNKCLNSKTNNREVDIWIDGDGKLKSNMKPIMLFRHNGDIVDVVLGGLYIDVGNISNGDSLGLTYQQAEDIIKVLVKRLCVCTTKDGTIEHLFVIDC